MDCRLQTDQSFFNLPTCLDRIFTVPLSGTKKLYGKSDGGLDGSTFRKSGSHLIALVPSIRPVQYLITLLLVLTGQVNASCLAPVAEVISVQGKVEFQGHYHTDNNQLKVHEKQPPQQTAIASTVDWQPLLAGYQLCADSTVRLGSYSRSLLHLSNNTFLRLDENSLVRFPQQQNRQSFWMELKQGIGHFISRIKNRFEITTPYTNAAVEGTEFVINVSDETTQVSVIEGLVKTSTSGEEITLGDGEKLTAGADFVNKGKLIVNPRNTVAWAIYFPPLLSFQELAAAASNNSQFMQLLRSSQDLVSAGRPDIAVQSVSDYLSANDDLSVINDSAEQSLAQVLYAALLLNVGNQEQAEQALLAMGNDHHTSALAFALRALISATQSDPENALKYADNALLLNADSATVYIASSFANQSALRLSEAQADAEKATQIDPNNPIAWYRLAETELILNHGKKAEEAILRALAIAPTNPQALSLAGLINLVKPDVDQAMQWLNQSLRIDSTLPDTRLGLGLALTRQGYIEQGREQLEYATSLNPANSVLRSYLGRTYFTEKRNAEAQVQWKLAQTFDPFDPTPHFYEGVQKLFENDPIGAADSIEESKALNANRGIYRSDRLLQSDAATRSATLGRVYNELGFDQAVFSEAWDALMSDPTSSDGHRLLADRYATLPEHEAATTSELLQAQLWQPLSAYPLQPQLSESDSTVIAGLGPQRPGLNEFHPLFTQDGAYATVNAIVGANDTWGEDLVISGLNGPVAMSLGQFHYESEGFRDNLEQEEDIYSGFLQWQFSPSLTSQLEIRKRSSETNRFQLEAIGLDNREETKEVETLSSRLGINYRINDQHAFIVSAIRQDFEEDQFVVLPGDITVTTANEREAKTIELQHVYRNDVFYSQFGFGQTSLETGTLVNNLLTNVATKADISYRNAYWYTGYTVHPKLNLTAGISYNWFDEDEKTTIVSVFEIVSPPQKTAERQWSPKLGITYLPTDAITIRMAAFRTFKRDIAADQTIEPVQVAGFNQLYDDVNTSDGKIYAGAIDYRFNPQSRLGLESIIRDVEVPFDNLAGTNLEEERADNFHRVYFYQRLNPYVALSTEYQFEDINLKYFRIGQGDIYRVTTHALPLQLSLFPGNRMDLSAELIYANQSVFTDPDESNARNEFKENGWISNLSVGYRLPKRYGKLEIGVNNVADTDKEFLNSDFDNVRYYPERFFYGRVQLSF